MVSDRNSWNVGHHATLSDKLSDYDYAQVKGDDSWITGNTCKITEDNVVIWGAGCSNIMRILKYFYTGLRKNTVFISILRIMTILHVLTAVCIPAAAHYVVPCHRELSIHFSQDHSSLPTAFVNSLIANWSLAHPQFNPGHILLIFYFLKINFNAILT
jgi:hypothetical protein